MPFLLVYKKMQDAMNKHPSADVLVNFASLRSAYQSTVETMEFPQIRTIAIIAEGIPENQTRKLIKLANEKHVSIIGKCLLSHSDSGVLHCRFLLTIVRTVSNYCLWDFSGDNAQIIRAY